VQVSNVTPRLSGITRSVLYGSVRMYDGQQSVVRKQRVSLDTVLAQVG